MELQSEPKIDDLSDDVLVNILSRVEHRDNVSRVCHRWYELDRAFTRELTVRRRPGVVLPERGLPALLSRYSNLTKLTLLDDQSKMQINDRSLFFVARGCVNLTDFSLSGCPIVTDAGIASIARLPRLTAVVLGDADSVTGLGLLALTNECVSLRRLDIYWLKLGGVLDWLEVIGVHREVERLSIQACPGVESSDLVKLGSRGWNNLREICFSPLDRSVEMQLDWRVAYSEGTEFCPFLEKLSITDCELRPMTGWLWILSQCKALRQVEIGRCFGVQDGDIRVLTEKNLQLSSLTWDIPNTEDSIAGPTNASFCDIARNCRYLQTLKLGFHGRKVPPSTRSFERGIVAIVESCVTLETLVFSAFHISTFGESLMTAIGCSTSLQDVQFICCKDLNDDMILHIGPNLRKLTLTMSPLLTDVCLNRFRDASRLKYLQVGQCPGITEEGARGATAELERWRIIPRKEVPA